MDDFAKLMGEQGVRRLGERRDPPARARPSRPRPETSSKTTPLPTETRPEAKPEPEAHDQPAGEPAPEAVAWATGRGAADTVQRALTRCLVERGSVALLVRVAGHLTARVGRLHATVAELAAEADAAEAELVVIEARGWKTIMHPASGVATLTENPAE